MSDENKKAIRAKLRFNSLDEFAKGYARYVSAGGIFIPTPASKLEPTGTIVRFQLTLASGENALLGEGRVHKSNGPNPSKPGAPVGLLLKFTRLSQSSKKLVDQIVAAKSGGDAPAEPEPTPPSADHAPTPQPTVPVSADPEEPPASDFAPTPVPKSNPALDSMAEDEPGPPAADLAPTPMPGSSAELAAAMMPKPSSAFSNSEQTRNVPRLDTLDFDERPPQPTSEMSGIFDGVEPAPPASDDHWFRTGTGRDQDPLETSQGEENYALFQQKDQVAEAGFDIFGEADEPADEEPSGEEVAEKEPAPSRPPERDVPTAENPALHADASEDDDIEEVRLGGPGDAPTPFDLDEGALDMLGSEVELSQPDEAGLAAQSAGRFSALEVSPAPADSSPSNPFGRGRLDLPEFSSPPLGDLDPVGSGAQPEPAPAPALEEGEGGEPDDDLEAGVAPESATSLDDRERLRPSRTQTASGSYRTLAKTEGGLRINAMDDAGASGEIAFGELDLADDEDAIDQMFDGLFGGGGGGDGGDGLFGGGEGGEGGDFGDFGDFGEGSAASPAPSPADDSPGVSAQDGPEQVEEPVVPEVPAVSTSVLPDAPGYEDDFDIDSLRDALDEDDEDDEDDEATVDYAPEVISEVLDEGDDQDFLDQLSEPSASTLEPPDSDVLEVGSSDDDEVFDLLGSLDEVSTPDGPVELHLAGPSTADSFVEEVEDDDSLAALLASARKDLEEHQAQQDEEDRDPVDELMSGDLPPAPEGQGAFSNMPSPTKKKGGFLSRFLKRDD